MMRNLIFAVIATIAATTMSAASASAANVVRNESGGANCNPTGLATHGGGSGGCFIHATSNGQVEFARFGSMASCDVEYWGRTDSAGVGYITTKTMTNCSSTVTPCDEGASGQDVWPFELKAETTQEAMFCFLAFGFANECTIETYAVLENDPGHLTTLSTPGGASHTDCDEPNGVEISGSWTLETGGAGEVETEIVDP
jgi:hypothetical protein